MWTNCDNVFLVTVWWQNLSSISDMAGHLSVYNSSIIRISNIRPIPPAVFLCSLVLPEDCSVRGSCCVRSYTSKSLVFPEWRMAIRNSSSKCQMWTFWFSQTWSLSEVIGVFLVFFYQYFLSSKSLLCILYCNLC